MNCKFNLFSYVYTRARILYDLFFFMYVLPVAERIESTTVSKQRARCLNAIFVPARAIARLRRRISTFTGARILRSERDREKISLNWKFETLINFQVSRLEKRRSRTFLVRGDRLNIAGKFETRNKLSHDTVLSRRTRQSKKLFSSPR